MSSQLQPFFDLFVGAPTSRHIIWSSRIRLDLGRNPLANDGPCDSSKGNWGWVWQYQRVAYPCFLQFLAPKKTGKKFRWVFIHFLGFYNSSCGYACSTNCVLRHLLCYVLHHVQKLHILQLFYPGSLQENLGILSGEGILHVYINMTWIYIYIYIYIYAHMVPGTARITEQTW